MDLVERLRERRAEIEQATLARVCAIADPREVGDPDYELGLRDAVRTALTHGIAGIAAATAREPALGPVPAQLLTQARAAARNGVSLEVVLRRCLAGHTLFGDFLLEAAEHESAISNADLKRALRAEAALLDRLVASVSEEYAHEVAGRSRGSEERRAERVRMLLAGELLEAADLDYELDAWHIGAIAAGPGARTALRDLATSLDRRLLSVRGGAGSVWAWLGGQRKVTARQALRLAETCWPGETSLALGEPAQGVEGWRLTHRQARAAIPIALCGAPGLLRYTDVALLASALSDEVLASSLRETYLTPLEEGRDGGKTLRQTLAAYFTAGRNASSAAAALGVDRRTVRIRLRTVEERIDRPLEDCAPELETALRLWELAHQ